MTGRLSNGMDTMPHSFDEWYDKTQVENMLLAIAKQLGVSLSLSTTTTPSSSSIKLKKDKKIDSSDNVGKTSNGPNNESRHDGFQDSHSSSDMQRNLERRHEAGILRGAVFYVAMSSWGSQRIRSLRAPFVGK